MELETIQNDAKAKLALARIGPWKSTPPARGAAKTSRFFNHCLGRKARTSDKAIGVRCIAAVWVLRVGLEEAA